MKHIAIDIGQVICHLDFSNFNKRFSYDTKMSEEEAYQFLVSTQKSHDLGSTTLEDDVCCMVGKECLPLILAEWGRTVIPNPKVVSWIEGLLKNDTKVALVSNIGTEHAETMKTLIPSIYNDPSTIKFFSCMVGARKPNYIYYQTFLSMFQEFKGCVYMDDNIENIKSGELFGFNSIHFDLSKMNDEQIEKKLKEIKCQIK